MSYEFHIDIESWDKELHLPFFNFFFFLFHGRNNILQLVMCEKEKSNMLKKTCLIWVSLTLTGGEKFFFLLDESENENNKIQEQHQHQVKQSLDIITNVTFTISSMGSRIIFEHCILLKERLCCVGLARDE